MKKIYRINIIIFSIVLLGLLFSFSAFDVNENSIIATSPQSVVKYKNTAAELVKNSKTVYSFIDVKMFSVNENSNMNSIDAFVQNGISLKIDRTALSVLNNSKPGNINLFLPASNNKTLELELVKTEMFPSVFKVKVMGVDGIKYEDYESGTIYTGIIKGDENSIATFSVFENNVMGIFSTDNGNYILGSVKDGNKNLTDNYILYNDIDVNNKPGFECGSGDSYDKFYKDPVKNPVGNHRDVTTTPVDMYFVCDYQMYLDAGNSTVNVINYVTGAFAHVKTLYQNDGLPVRMTPTVFVYTTADPYRNLTTSTAILEEFGARTQNNLEGGDLAHLLSTGHGQQLGGIAWINVLCQSYEPSSRFGRFAFSNIEGTYTPYPTYSWTIMVITHEIGHNFGSMHTFACAWPLPGGGIGAIDSCVQAEGTCFSTTRANLNGTIMSYCHLNGAINLTRGFGPLPRDTITLRYNQALCLDNPLNSSEAPVAFNLLQNYPNPFNPSTNIKFALPLDGFVNLRVYDMVGREVASLISSQYYPIGIFSYTFDAGLFNLASGVYFYKIDVSKDNNSVYSEIKKMVLVK